HSDAVLFEFEKATQMAMQVMTNVSHPDGFNIGVNQGEAGGAGVATHLHQHLVPRWNGDSNFMPIVAQTRTIPILLENQRAAYAAEAARIAPEFGL
nr:HIT domain-containing protein [Alloscardovia omnicolens]